MAPRGPVGHEELARMPYLEACLKVAALVTLNGVAAHADNTLRAAAALPCMVGFCCRAHCARTFILFGGTAVAGVPYKYRCKEKIQVQVQRTEGRGCAGGPAAVPARPFCGARGHRGPGSVRPHHPTRLLGACEPPPPASVLFNTLHHKLVYDTMPTQSAAKHGACVEKLGHCQTHSDQACVGCTLPR